MAPQRSLNKVYSTSLESSRIAHSIGTALDRFIKNNQDQFQYASGELSQLLRDIALASKVVNREVNKAGLVDIIGSAGEENIQGEVQQKLDVYANEKFISSLKNRQMVCGIASEENENCIIFETGSAKDGKYLVMMDPLDGSSNIDVNVSIGTIFSIYRRKSKTGTPIQQEDILQRGEEQVAAARQLDRVGGHVLHGRLGRPHHDAAVRGAPDVAPRRRRHLLRPLAGGRTRRGGCGPGRTGSPARLPPSRRPDGSARGQPGPVPQPGGGPVLQHECRARRAQPSRGRPASSAAGRCLEGRRRSWPENFARRRP